ncbi:hypothetical protein [Sphingobacterium hotanense]|uniref:hypothetical protein n=1 Tax=Sphingobacterium hotanense TaxID=649196 RepID=UPI0021A2D2F9|nr:hypothetical protein [Sphingobacterium hotanense]MCT1526431.1 hypothetical protein [Sphingobacterium hotanense]
MMKYFYSLMLLFVIGTSYSQDFVLNLYKQNKLTLESPKSTTFSLYGSYPVNLYTGNLVNSFNLFEIEQNGYVLPITINYSYANHKPSTIPSQIGLGFDISYGGHISRIVRGRLDEKMGFFQNSGELDYYNQHREFYLDGVVSSSLDNEPDIFHYTCGNFSGTFYFQNQKVVKTTFDNVLIFPNLNPSNNRFESFIIKTPDGIEYWFSEAEYSTIRISNIEPDYKYESGWLITKIQINPTSFINFQYSANDVNYNTASFLSNYVKNDSDGISYFGGLSSSHLSTNSRSTVHFERYLEKIIFINGSIDFSMVGRSDRGVTRAKKIESIKLINEKGIEMERFKFSYIENSNERLKLSNIVKQSGNNLELFRKFEYNPLKFPWDSESPYNSNQTDYWGFYNGQFPNDHTNRIPRVYLNGKLYGEALRTPNIDYATAEILTKVFYPSGGHTEFFYESHDFNEQGESYSPFRNEIVSRQSYEFTFESGQYDLDPYQMFFTLPTETKVTVFKHHQGAGPNTKWIPGDKDGETRDILLSAGTHNVGSLLNADYLNHPDNSDIYMARGGVDFSAISLQDVDFVNKGYGGGIRIAKVVNHSGDKTMTKRYLYRRNKSDELSSGILTRMATYIIRTQDIIGNLHGEYASSSPILGFDESEIVGYMTVFEVNDDGSFTKMYFNTINNIPDDPAYFEIATVNPKLNASVTNKHLRGKLLKKEYYTATDKLLMREDYTYSFLDDSRAKTLTYALIEPTVSVRRYRAGGEEFYDRISATMNTLFEKTFRFMPLTKKTTTKFETGTTIVEEENYTYFNDKHSFPNIINTIRSSEQLLTSYLNYPLDYANSFTTLKDLNKISNPVEQLTIINSPITSVKSVIGQIGYPSEDGYVNKVYTTHFNSELGQVKLSNRAVGIFPPSGSDVAYSPDLRYELMFEILKRDDFGNPLEVKKQNLPSTVYLWGYNGQYPVARIENATYAEVLTALGGGTVATTKLTALNAVGVTESTINSTIGSIRSTLTKANVSTYTYTPLVGMKSMTDARGVTEYYEFDGFQRLKEVLDFDRNVLKEYQYHYRPN